VLNRSTGIQGFERDNSYPRFLTGEKEFKVLNRRTVSQGFKQENRYLRF